MTIEAQLKQKVRFLEKMEAAQKAIIKKLEAKAEHLEWEYENK